MLNAPKSSVGLMTRKIFAFFVAYCFFAGSVWSMALSGERLQERYAHGMANRSGLHQLAEGDAMASAFSRAPQRPFAAALAPQKIFTNFAALNAPAAAMQAAGGATATVPFFGPQQYVRTTGAPNSYTTTVQVPSSVSSPFILHIQSGEANGTNRVSSATITLNGVQAAAPSDFNQTVFTLDRAVTLTTPQSTLVVTLAGKPGSYLRISISGSSGDHTPPRLTITAPADNSAINSPQAHLDIHYLDVPGTGETAASGVDTNTLQVLLDGVDRSGLFTRRSDEATADLPTTLALAPGPHTLQASISDLAGNKATANSHFQVDLTPPSLQILQPVAGSYLSNTTPQVSLAYSDNLAVDTASLKVTINGTDSTALFTKTATGATATLSTALRSTQSSTAMTSSSI